MDDDGGDISFEKNGLNDVKKISQNKISFKNRYTYGIWVETSFEL